MEVKPFLVAPSILSADFARLGEEIREVDEAGADWLHVDVMDGHFVPNLTIGAPVVKKLRPHSKKIFDVHLMIEKPERFLKDFIDAGSDYITIHVESTDQVDACLEKIRGSGRKAGLTLRPGTPITELEPFLNKVDLILIMTVNPGFGGQSFMGDQIQKIDWVRDRLDQLNSRALIEVDGGINPETAALCKGADVLVAGNFVFGRNYREAIQALKNARG